MNEWEMMIDTLIVQQDELTDYTINKEKLDFNYKSKVEIKDILPFYEKG